MAASNKSPSPGSQLLQADNAYNDEWRQAEDNEWPTLIPSIEHGKYFILYRQYCTADLSDPHLGPPQHVDRNAQAEVDEAILDGIVSRHSGQSSRQASQQASQQAPIKVFTRPISSGKDPAAGFSFTKAKPVQQFDFRRLKQAPVIPQPPEVPRPSEGLATETFAHHPPSGPDSTQVEMNVIDVAAHQSPKYEGHNASMPIDPLPVPSQNLTPAHSRDHKHPTPITTNGPIMLDFSFTRAPPNEVSTAVEDILTDNNLNRKNEPCLLNIIIPDHGEPAATAPAPIQISAEMMKDVNQLQVNMQNRSRNISKDPLASVVGAPKITKSRQKKKRIGADTDGPPPPSNSKVTYTEDDLLKLLMYRRRQGQQELEYFRATKQQTEAETQKLRDESNRLSSQLREVIHRETQKSAELSKLRASKPILEGKIKRLSACVKGLTNDHNRLREDADVLNRQHQDVFVAKEEVHNALKDAHRSLEQERVRSQQLKDGARHEIETLAQSVQNLSTQHQSDENLLTVERERSNQLEDQISRITASHGQLLELFTGHRDSITGKIDNVLDQAQKLAAHHNSSELCSHDPIRPMLEQCVGMLQKLHEADNVRSEDLQKLNDTVDSFTQGITLSVEACEENFTSIETGQKQLTLAMQDQIQALGGNVFSEHALSEQISDLREVRATIRARLQATESSLADARKEVAALRLRDQEQMRRIVTLETDVGKSQSQPAQSPQALLRIQELDSRNKDLQSEIVTLRKESADLSSQLRQSSTEAGNVIECLAIAEAKLEATKEETARLREETSACERQAMLESERLRKELSNAANMQLANMQSEHMNLIHQLKLESSPIEEKLKTVTRHFNLSKAETEKAENETKFLRSLLKEAQNEKEAVIGSRKALQLHLKEMEARMLDKNNEYADLQAKSNKAKDQIKAKDLDIIALQASLAKRPSSSKVIEQNSNVRGVQSTGNGHALHRDSEHVSIDQNPSVQPTISKKSKHFTNRPPVVEDSQPTDKPSFVSLDDLMLEDPFASYAQEGPQTIAGEDIAHLFPSTPGAGSYAKDLDYSRKSVFHTTIVSETQRRQHQPFREATPHTGTHITNKPRSQSHAHSKPQPQSGQIDALSRSTATTSTPKVTSSRRDPKSPSEHREASIMRESIQPRSRVKDPRQGKRDTISAGFNETNLQARPSKMQKAEHAKQAKASGPVTEDSQPPLLNGRSRKLTRKPSAPKVDKFTRRFAQP